jgi:DNA-binding CsgD family transcriptional regulator
LPHLTEREREILNLVAQGLSSSAIARMLRLSETVEWHALQAIKRLDAKNRIQAVVLAIRDGLIALEQKPLNQGMGWFAGNCFCWRKRALATLPRGVPLRRRFRGFFHAAFQH